MEQTDGWCSVYIGHQYAANGPESVFEYQLRASVAIYEKGSSGFFVRIDEANEESSRVLLERGSRRSAGIHQRQRWRSLVLQCDPHSKLSSAVDEVQRGPIAGPYCQSNSRLAGLINERQSGRVVVYGEHRSNVAAAIEQSET